MTGIESNGTLTRCLVVADLTEAVAFRRQLAESARQYRLLAENASDVVLSFDVSGHVTWVSPSVTETLGWAPEDVVERTLADLVHPDDLALARSDRAAAVANRTDTATTSMRFARRDGQWRWMSARAQILRDGDGAPAGVVEALRDIDAEVVAQESLAGTEDLLRTALVSAPIGMAMTSISGAFEFVNPALCRMLGREEVWLRAHSVDDVMHPEDVGWVMAERAAAFAGDTDLTRKPARLIAADGQVVWVTHAGQLIQGRAGAADRLLVQYLDVTVEHGALEQLEYQAFHDPLTGLRNRAWIVDMLDVDLQTARRTGASVGVLFIDLDNFKLVNDSLGHAAGDAVLIAVANRISRVLRARDHVGRFGGDEFVVIVTDAERPLHVERVVQRIETAVGEEFEIQGHRIVPTASIGVAVSTSTSTGAGLLRDADSALFRAKAGGRALWHFYDEGMNEQAVARLTLESEMRTALSNDEFVVHYQPIVALSDERIVGYEALVRWQHPRRGLLAPAAFLHEAEDCGLIVGIGEQVLDQVCALLARRPDLPGPISVNISAVQLARADWLDTFTATLARHQVDPARVTVEVTETAVLSLLAGTHSDLFAVREMGAGVHLDDFGTGFSSISLLRDLPVTGLKLDASFVADLSQEAGALNALSSGLAGLANGLGLTGIAEGIECAEQARILRDQGWPHAQGYLYGRPAPMPPA